MFEKVKTVAKNTSNNKSTMLQDILKKRKTEIDRINGAVDREVPYHMDEWVEIDHRVEISKTYALTVLYFLNGEY